MDFFNKNFKIALIAIVAVELVSLLGYLMPTLGPVAFFIILIITVIASLTKLEYGLYIILAELFIGSHGYLFAAQIGSVSISLRMALFMAVLAVWLWQLIKNGWSKIPKVFDSLAINYLVLAIILLGGFIGGIKNNGFGNAFFDFNGWLYFSLILIFSAAIKNRQIIDNILRILLAATTWLSIKTILTLILFSHQLATIGDPFYKWLRDSRIGEITYVSGTIFRIFFQSQIYVLIGLMIFLLYFLSQYKNTTIKQKIYSGLYLYLSSLTIIISQSRSFWLGGLTALIFLLIFSWQFFDFKIKKTALMVVLLTAAIASQLILVQIITGNFSGNLLIDRFQNLEREAGSSSRLNQLPPLSDSISKSLFFGYGFGKELTYQSTDPRILASHPGGWYTTAAFEWGYLDIWLKIGLAGLLTYLILISQLAKKLWQKKQTLSLGLLLGLIALLVTSIFSPYLNHPLGIGYLILISAILPVI